MKIFLGLTILMIPVIQLYRSKDGYQEDEQGLFKKTMLGNMGEAKTKCQFWYITSKKQTDISCDNGQISQLIHFGLKPEHQDSV